MDLREKIVGAIRQVATESGKELTNQLDDETVLLQSGLDSLDFAIVVARLEEELNADPFSATSEPIYPRTLAEFVAVYEEHFAPQQ